MLTNTDIPPGGEGKIEVTFDSNHKRGNQKKSITVESNDARNPRATLEISAQVEIVFGFEQYSLDMGNIRKGEPFSKTATFLVKDESLAKTISLTSTSSFVTARLVDVPNNEKGRLTVEVSGASNTPVGRLNATITAHSSAGKTVDANLYVRGVVTGNYEVVPEIIHFYVDTTKSELRADKIVVKVTSSVEGAKLKVLGAQDEYGRVEAKVKTLLPDKQYEITLTVKPSALATKKSVSGVIDITTDDKDLPVAKVSYSILFR